MLLEPPPPPADAFRGPEPPRDARPAPGTGARVWLVRHGRVTAPDVAYGDDDVPLSADGERDTEAAVASLSALPDVAAVLSSPLVRARSMGAALAGILGLELQVRDGLRELHRGRWQGLARTEFHRRWCAETDAYWKDPLHWRGHGGESEHQLVERGWPVLLEAVERAGGGTAVITAHRQIIRALVASAVGIPAARSHALQLDPGGGVLLVDDAFGWVLHRSNVHPPGAAPLAEPADGPPEDVPFTPPEG